MKKKEPIINFKLIGIKTEQYALFEENYNPKLRVDLSTNLEIKIIESNQQVGVFLEIEFIQKKKPFLKIETSCHFNIAINNWVTLKNVAKAEIVFPKNFIAHLAMITTGTARGILFAKTENTIFSKFFVPTLDINEMITEDATFLLTDEE